MKFSDRLGITTPKSVIQLNDIDSSLRNKLWNVIYFLVIIPLEDEINNDLSFTRFNDFFISLWHNFFEKPIDTIPTDKFSVISIVRDYFFNTEWFNVYNIVDFIYVKLDTIDKDEFKESINKVLASELSAYRYVGKELIQLTDKNEIMEIEDVLLNSESHNFQGVKLHIEHSLRILSNKEKPDYRNSIKESISAVEAAAQILTGDKNAELGKALTLLKSRIDLHGALEQGFKKIYGYTSDSSGIRHALLEKDNLDIEDAKFMLVSCSAFINYLIVKTEKVGLLKR